MKTVFCLVALLIVPAFVMAQEPKVVEIKFLHAFPDRFKGKEVKVTGWPYKLKTTDSKKVFLLGDMNADFLQVILRGKTVAIETTEDFPETLLGEKITIVGTFDIDAIPVNAEALEELKKAGKDGPTKKPFIKQAKILID